MVSVLETKLIPPTFPLDHPPPPEQGQYASYEEYFNALQAYFHAGIMETLSQDPSYIAAIPPQSVVPPVVEIKTVAPVVSRLRGDYGWGIADMANSWPVGNTQLEVIDEVFVSTKLDMKSQYKVPPQMANTSFPLPWATEDLPTAQLGTVAYYVLRELTLIEHTVCQGLCTAAKMRVNIRQKCPETPYTKALLNKILQSHWWRSVGGSKKVDILTNLYDDVYDNQDGQRLLRDINPEGKGLPPLSTIGANALHTNGLLRRLLERNGPRITSSNLAVILLDADSAYGGHIYADYALKNPFGCDAIGIRKALSQWAEPTISKFSEMIMNGVMTWCSIHKIGYLRIIEPLPAMKAKLLSLDFKVEGIFTGEEEGGGGGGGGDEEDGEMDEGEDEGKEEAEGDEELVDLLTDVRYVSGDIPTSYTEYGFHISNILVQLLPTAEFQTDVLNVNIHGARQGSVTERVFASLTLRLLHNMVHFFTNDSTIL